MPAKDIENINILWDWLRLFLCSSRTDMEIMLYPRDREAAGRNILVTVKSYILRTKQREMYELEMYERERLINIWPRL